MTVPCSRIRLAPLVDTCSGEDAAARVSSRREAGLSGDGGAEEDAGRGIREDLLTAELTEDGGPGNAGSRHVVPSEVDAGEVAPSTFRSEVIAAAGRRAPVEETPPADSG